MVNWKIIVSAILSFLVESLIPIKSMLINQISQQRIMEQVPLKIYIGQLLIIYLFVYACLFFSIYVIIMLIERAMDKR